MRKIGELPDGSSSACASLGRIDQPACRESPMNPRLYYIFAQQRIADLQRAAEHARLATDASTRQRDSRDPNPIVRALPMPTAHPSPEAWPAANLPAGASPTPGRRAAPPVGV
jgi:hypothetical protein